MKYELWMEDEYGQRSIIRRDTNLDNLIEEAKEKVSDANVNNPLTVADKARAWEVCYVELYDPEDEEFVDTDSAIYTGRDNTGRHSVLLVDEGETMLLEDVAADIRVYLGDLDGESWYAEDERGLPVSSFDHRDMQKKSVYFVRKVK